MEVQVIIPNSLQKFVGGKKELVYQAINLKDLLDTIDNDFSGFKSRICDTEGNLKGYFNVYIDGEDSRHLEGMQSKFRENSELIIVAAVAGG